MHARGDAASREARELSGRSGLPYSVAKGIVSRHALASKALVVDLVDLDGPPRGSRPADHLWSRLGSEVWAEVAGPYLVHRAHDLAANVLDVRRHVAVGAVVVNTAAQFGVPRSVSSRLEDAWGAYEQLAAAAAASAEHVNEMLALVEARWRHDEYWERLADEQVTLVQLTESLMRAAASLGHAILSCIDHAPAGRDLTWVFGGPYCDWGDSQIHTAFHNAGALTNHGLLCDRFRRTALLELVATYGDGNWLTLIPSTNRDELLEHRPH